nr:MAG TPA: hypothetical protein [Caudoviricetes sp.]
MKKSVRNLAEIHWKTAQKLSPHLARFRACLALAKPPQEPSLPPT